MFNYAGLTVGALLLSMCSITYGVTCPDLKKYSPKFQQRAAETLDEASPEIQQMINDYGGLRQAIRVCERRQER